MRLICPNCDAQYEVDGSLIPAEGRDVQCSACGHVWFQAPDMQTEDEALWDAAPVAEPELEPDNVPAAAPVPPAPSPGRVSAAQPVDETSGERDDEGPDPEVLRRHTLDESLMAVLREEAERETAARAAEAARQAGRGLEMQPDLGLPEAEPASRLRIRPRTPAAEPAPPRREPEDLRPDPDTDPGTELPVGGAAASRPARRELLPDIERINSTLAASGSARDAGATPGMPQAQAGAQRSGFRLGFLLMIGLALAGLAVYSQAPLLSRTVPAAEPVLTRFVAGVDRARVGLDGLVNGLLSRFQG